MDDRQSAAGGRSNRARRLSRFAVTDADGLAANTDPALLILDISRRDIEACNIASVLERLHVLTDSAENARRYRESLLFQVEGYDADPRPIPAIPEVRVFFQRLVAEWPHWLWFLLRDAGAVALLFALLCEVRIVRGQRGTFGTEFLRNAQVTTLFTDLLRRGNALFDAYEITGDEVTRSAESALAELLPTEGPGSEQA
jgi:hypothetical protein